jgi:hypothetical protein
MAAAEQDILIEQGASFSMFMTVRDESFQPIDITEYTFRGKIKKDFSDSAAQAEFTFVKLDQTQEASKGKVEITLTPTQTSEIQTNSKGLSRTIVKMVYDIESQTPAGFVTRWLQGIAKISPEVTK